MEYERVERLSSIIKEMAAAGVSHERIARLVINQNTGKPISVETLQKYYGQELEIGRDEANLAMSRSAFAQGIGSPGVPNPNYGKLQKGTKLIDKRKWLVEPIAPVPTMTIWWERTRAGKNEGTVQPPGRDRQPLVQQRTIVVLPSNGRENGGVPVLDLLPHKQA